MNTVQSTGTGGGHVNKKSQGQEVSVCKRVIYVTKIFKQSQFAIYNLCEKIVSSSKNFTKVKALSFVIISADAFDTKSNVSKTSLI